MIDTIVMRIHKLSEKYSDYPTYLQNIANHDKTQIKYGSKSIFKDDVQNYAYYADTSKVRYLSVRNAVNSVSSHYNINFNTNYERDYIEVNLSIPKYFYGTNVFQFTDSRNMDILQIWNKLERFFKNFFALYFPIPPNYMDVEINRIDMCLNQIFDTKEDALKYLARQKEINIANARSDKNRFSDYGSTTIQYVTSNYSFKIYHKGTEFKKNDLNQLTKLYIMNNGKVFDKNRGNDVQYIKINGIDYDLEEISNVADRTLRYEITFRKGGLNYVFKQSVVNDTNTMVNHHLSNIAHSKKIKRCRDFLNNEFENKQYHFHLASIWDFTNSTNTDLCESKEFSFNYELFTQLHNFFMVRVYRYQLDKKLTIPEMYEKLQKATEKKKILTRETDNNNMLLILAMLSQYTNVEDLKQIIPKRTYYRYKKKLKEAEIHIQSIDEIFAPPLDFGKYFELLGKYHVNFN